MKLLAKRVSAIASDFNKLQTVINSSQRKTEAELKKTSDELGLAKLRLAKTFRTLEQSQEEGSGKIMKRIGDYVSSRDESSRKQIAMLRKEYEAKLKRSLENKSESRSSAVKRKQKFKAQIGPNISGEADPARNPLPFERSSFPDWSGCSSQ